MIPGEVRVMAALIPVDDGSVRSAWELTDRDRALCMWSISGGVGFVAVPQTPPSRRGLSWQRLHDPHLERGRRRDVATSSCIPRIADQLWIVFGEQSSPRFGLSPGVATARARRAHLSTPVTSRRLRPTC
jgi:hypothetical protein